MKRLTNLNQAQLKAKMQLVETYSQVLIDLAKNTLKILKEAENRQLLP